MNTFGISHSSFLHLHKTMAPSPAMEQVLVLGSGAKGNFRHGSDFDLVLKGKGMNLCAMTRLRTFFNEELPIPSPVDALNYAAISSENLKNHVDRTGKVLYERKTTIV